MEGDDSVHRMDGIAQRAKRAKLEHDSESSISSHVGYSQQCMRTDSTSAEALLNFATAADELELNLKRQKIPRDPMSHRIIEKRRRDRMNNCLADLSRLIPSTYHKQGQGRIEKTEIIEMAIKHINTLQQRVDQAEKKAKEEPPPVSTMKVDHQCCASKFYLGFKEAQDEVMRFLIEVQNASTMDPFCKKIMKYMEKASKKFITNPMSGENLPSRHCPENQEAHNSQQGYTSHERSDRSGYYDPNRRARSNVSDRYNMNEMPKDESYQSMEASHRDKHLRSLLADQQHSSVATGNNVETGGNVPVFSYSNMSNNRSVTTSGEQANSSCGELGSSGYSSDLSTTEKSFNQSRNDVYKFKHNITKRFSQEGQGHNQPSDTSSSTSSRDFEDDQRHFKWKGASPKAHQNMLDGAHDPIFSNTEGTNNATNTSNTPDLDSVSSDETRRQRNSGKSGRSPGLSVSSGRGEDGDHSSFVLPGFILHPSGTHYMPISVQNTNISGLLENSFEDGGMPVFHPISIPVYFRRPVI